MRKLILLCCAVLFFLNSELIAQNIAGYRYWWDDDVSSVVNTTVSAGEIFDLNINPATADLGNGHHTLTVQIKDNDGIWSIPYTKTFYQSGNLTAFEYWIDDDIASSTSLNLSSTDVQDVNTEIDAASLSPGVHKLTVRSVANNGETSVPYSTLFKLSGGDLISWEYWYDDDISTRVQSAVSPPQNTFDLMQNLNTSGLESGDHTITWRAVDAVSEWSVPLTYAFSALVGVDEIPGLKAVIVYPNPAHSELGIRIDGNGLEPLDVEIISSEGRMIRLIPKAVSTANHHFRTDISGLAAGTYFVKLTNGRQATMLKFVKQ